MGIEPKLLQEKYDIVRVAVGMPHARGALCVVTRDVMCRLKIYPTEVIQNITFCKFFFFFYYIAHPSAQNTTPTTSTTQVFFEMGLLMHMH